MNLALLIAPADLNVDDALRVAEAEVKFRASFSAVAVPTIDLAS